MMNGAGQGKLSDAEKTRFAAREVIANDDPTALCTKPGWEAREKLTQRDVNAYTPGLVFTAECEKKKKNEASTYRRKITIESERYIDARAVAMTLLGASEVTMSSVLRAPTKPLPRWQVRWVGSAMSPGNMPRREVRQLDQNGTPSAWRSERDASAEIET